MHLQHLFLGRHTLGIGVVDKEIVTVEFDASALHVQDIVALDIIKQLFESRMKRLDAGGIL